MGRRNLFLTAVCMVIGASLLLTGHAFAGAAPSGVVNVNITQSPAYSYSHVWATVQSVSFHPSKYAEPGAKGWVTCPVGVTVDLLASTPTYVDALASGCSLPVGAYQQVRLVTAGTNDTLTPSAVRAALAYNNEVVTGTSGSQVVSPLYVTHDGNGIKLLTNFKVKSTDTASTPLNLAIRFDAADDILPLGMNGGTQYFLKGDLGLFNMAKAGAVTGSIDSTSAVANGTAKFVFKTEGLNNEGNAYVVKQSARLNTDGTFTFYPLPVPNGTSTTYDIMMRGLDYDTVIIQGVPVTAGTSPTSSPTVIPQVTLTPATNPDYEVSVTTPIQPTGATLNFYQWVPGSFTPYEIRWTLVDPITGLLYNNNTFPLSADPIHVGRYNSSSITLTPTTPFGGDGAFLAVASAPYYGSSSLPVSPTNNTFTFTLNPADATIPSSISGQIFIPNGLGLTDGLVIVSRHGTIVTTVDAKNQMTNGGFYAIADLPGGIVDSLYTVQAIGWSSSTPPKIAVSQMGHADLKDANATNVNLILRKVSK